MQPSETIARRETSSEKPEPEPEPQPEPEPEPPELELQPEPEPEPQPEPEREQQSEAAAYTSFVCVPVVAPRRVICRAFRNVGYCRNGSVCAFEHSEGPRVATPGRGPCFSYEVRASITAQCVCGGGGAW
jgi:hypothetical protein